MNYFQSYNLPPTVMPQAELNNRKSGEDNEAYEMDDGVSMWNTCKLYEWCLQAICLQSETGFAYF